jgi:AraC-like DNA-binding protein
MAVQTHGTRKYPTSALLQSSAGLGWSTISAAEIISSRLSLAQIASNAWFSSQASFTRAFRRATGVTPAEYRRGRVKPSTHILSATPAQQSHIDRPNAANKWRERP